MLEQHFPDAFQRDAALDGYSCDFRIDLRGNGGDPADSLAIIIDHGAGEADPARHLRLQLERCDLLRNAGMSAVTRVPAWQVHTASDGVISALTAGIVVPAEDRDNVERIRA